MLAASSADIAEHMAIALMVPEGAAAVCQAALDRGEGIERRLAAGRQLVAHVLRLQEVPLLMARQ